MNAAVLLAHAGGFGWDEALFVAIPVVVLLILGRQARKKAEAAAAAAEAAEAANSADGRPDSVGPEG